MTQQQPRIRSLSEEIADPLNISESFDYVISHLENAEQREHFKPKKEEFCKLLEKQLATGEFRITPDDIREIVVVDGPKTRVCQCPYVFHRVGCHAVMVPVEGVLHPTLIKNTAASIKGRGMHWLHQIIEEDLLADAENMLNYYQCDILGFYDHINQDKMKKKVRVHIDDKIVLSMLDNFITLLRRGLSKGLRSSQCLANLYLSDIDHKMCEKVSYHEIEVKDDDNVVVKGKGRLIINGKEIRFHYYRYCDDIVIIARTKKELWELRNYLKSLLAELDLTIKPSEAVRPISEGIDFLGFNTYVDDTGEERIVYSRIRKRTKKKFARRLKDVKSRKRRQSLIGSFFGMAAHADCRHLLKKLLLPHEYRKLKHKRKMKDFGEFKLKQTTLDGKKNFRGNKISPRDLSAQGFIVVDFERGVVARRDKDDYNRRLQDAAARGISPDLVEKPKDKYVMQVIYHPDLQEVWCGRSTLEKALSKIAQENRNSLGVILRKMWSGDRSVWNNLNQLESEGEVPFFSSIEMDYTGQYPKAYFVSPTKYGMRPATDEELDYLLEILNLK